MLGGFETVSFADVSGMNIVNVKVGARLVFHDRSSLYIGYGRALTDATWYEDIARIEFRQSF